MEINVPKKWQNRTFILCWLLYASVYFGRVNISVAIPEIESAFGWSRTQIGLIGSLFFWTYGIGHFVNGYIGDKVSSRLYIFAGLILISISNIFFGFSTSLIMMATLWALNGFFQSMIWGPMIKTLSYWFENSKRNKIATAISTSMVGGYLLAWGVAGKILQMSNWKWVFWTPGIFLLIFSVIWLIGIRNHPKDVGFEDPNKINFAKESKNNCLAYKSMSLWQIINKSKLWFVVVACGSKGIIKEGISLWGPIFLMETQGLNLKSTIGLILLIPFMNFIGMLLAGWLNKKYDNHDKLTVIILLSVSMVTSAALIIFGKFSPLLGLLFLGLTSAMMYGSNTILLGSIPMSYAKYNKTSSVAGFLDFSSYLAAGLSTILTGFIIDLFGWNGVLIFWIVAAMIGVVSLILNLYFEKATEIPLTSETKSG